MDGNAMVCVYIFDRVVVDKRSGNFLPIFDNVRSCSWKGSCVTAVMLGFGEKCYTGCHKPQITVGSVD